MCACVCACVRVHVCHECVCLVAILLLLFSVLSVFFLSCLPFPQQFIEQFVRLRLGHCTSQCIIYTQGVRGHLSSNLTTVQEFVTVY